MSLEFELRGWTVAGRGGDLIRELQRTDSPGDQRAEPARWGVIVHDSARIRRRIGGISWTMAIILGAESASGLWFLLDVWTRHGWLRGLMARSPAAVASALVFVGLLFYHRPRPLPAWAMPDDGTVLYGLGLAVFCGVGVVILTIIRAAGG